MHHPLKRKIVTPFFLLICLFSEYQLLFSQSTQPNILFITLDDQNDYMEGFDGQAQVETPNIKRIEDKGTLFYNAYCSSPQCAPSRTSLLTGKDCFYTKVYNNQTYKCRDFRSFFTEETNNAEIITLPQYLKDSAGYYTYHFNKVMHCFENMIDFDIDEPDACARQLSWNEIFYFEDSAVITTAGEANIGGPNQFQWAKLDNALETSMEDYVMIDTVIQYIQHYIDDPSITCNKPLFLAVGFQRPHLPYYIPEKYYSDYYADDFYELSFKLPYQNPEHGFPYNGIIMPPQPEIPYSDFDQLPQDGVAFSLADIQMETTYNNYIENLSPYPQVDEYVSDEKRTEILEQSVRANAVLAYLATIKYTDAQIGRLLDALEQHPEFYNNTIIILVSDHGFSLGEKRHWRKGALWETDTRVPFIYTDMRNPYKQVCEEPVSLLDIFPTLCSALDIPYPKFESGEAYLDGKNLLPVFTSAEESWERPVITTYIEKIPTEEGGCFPQYSIRNKRFHYISYQTNGGDACNTSASIRQEELYEIGEHRETDPYEWNNLADNPDYLPIKKYLQQWLPDSNFYLQKTIQAQIITNNLPCLLSNSDTIFASAILSDTTGLPFGFIPDEYTLKWFTNLETEIYEGNSYSFSIADFSDEIIQAKQKIILYLEVYDSENNIAGFSVEYFYCQNNNPKPTADFTVSVNGNTACILDYQIEGNYLRTWWDFGEGNLIYAKQPGYYSYQQAGNYTITNYIEYGNEPCIETVQKTIYANEASQEVSPLKLYPNPAQSSIHVLIDADVQDGLFTVYDETGRSMFSQFISTECCATSLEINVTHFARGIYSASLISENSKQSSIFIVER